MLGLLIRDKFNLEYFCGAPFVLSSGGHCYKEGNIRIYIYISVFVCRENVPEKPMCGDLPWLECSCTLLSL